MGITDLFLLALGLAMDAFAVSICKGLATNRVKAQHMLTCGAWFGGFQALMPLIGYFLFVAVKDYIEGYDHWIAFVLLAFIGGKMIKEALSGEENFADGSFAAKIMLVMALATSIDALAAGIALVRPDVNIWLAVLFVGVITFILSAIGVKIGNVFGAKYKNKAEFAGGVILILMGVKILLEDLGIIAF